MATEANSGALDSGRLRPGELSARVLIDGFLIREGEMGRRSLLWQVVHLFYLGRAISKGPGYLAGYEVRRYARKAVYRATRGWGRPRRRRW